MSRQYTATATRKAARTASIASKGNGTIGDYDKLQGLAGARAVADRGKIVCLLYVQDGGAWPIVLVGDQKSGRASMGVMYQMRPDGEKPGPLFKLRSHT
jgi:hypothetical protein